MLRALEPSALDVSLQVAQDIEAERQRLERTWRQRLERAQYEVDRATRQYNAVEPENRLVARGLEKQLEEKLRAKKVLVEEYDRELARQPTAISAEEREAIRALAADIPALWSAQTTTAAERQTIVRQLVEKVVVTVQGETERVDMIVHWVGGHQTKAWLIRPVARLEQLSNWNGLVDRIRQLRAEGLTADAIASRLNAEHFSPPKRRATFNSGMVRAIVSRSGLARSKFRPQHVEQQPLPEGEWRLADLARELAMPAITLYSWLQRGWVSGRRLDEPGRPWAIKAAASELARLRQLRSAPKLGWRAVVPKMAS